MGSNDRYRNGMNDASRIYDRQYRDLEGRIKDSLDKQDKINERTHRLQSEMIDNEERMDQDIEKICDFLNIDRTPGSSGTATVGENTEAEMARYTNGVLNRYNSFTNVHMESFSPEIIDAIADIVTASLERGLNANFHKKLNILEQNGILSQEKFEQHQRNVVRAKAATAVGIYAAFTMIPYICEGVKTFLQKQDYIDFFVGVYGYINQEMNPLINQNISDLFAGMGIKASTEKINTTFEKYCDNRGISYLPLLSRRSSGLFTQEGRELLAKEIISRCDLHSDDVFSRAEDFVQSYLGLTPTQVKSLMADAQASQDSLSDIIWFSAIDYRYLFADFIRDVTNARQFASINIDNDPYRVMREERRTNMEKIIEGVVKQKSLFLTNKKRKDIIDSSAKLMKYSLNPSYDVSMQTKIIKRERKILEYYGYR